MSERYCFYCGSKLGVKEVCACRNREQAFQAKSATQHASQSAQTTSKNTEQTDTHSHSKTSKFWQPPFAQLKAKFCTWRTKWQLRCKQSLKQIDFLTLSQRLAIAFRACLQPTSSISIFTSCKTLTSFCLAIIYALLTAFNFQLLLKNSTLGRIFSLYLNPVTGASFSVWAILLKIAIISFLVFLAKVIFYRFIFARWKMPLTWQTSLSLVNAGLVYGLLFSVLALSFAHRSPLQFVLVYCLGQCLIYYLDVKSVLSKNLQSEDRAIVLIALTNLALIALTALLIRLLMPEFVTFNMV